MHLKKSALSRFDTRSLALFASLPLVAALALRPGLASAQAVFGPSAPAKAATSAAPTSRTPVVDTFRQVDTDGNGSVSRAEALRAGILARSFDKLDANKDGALSRAEFDRASK